MNIQQLQKALYDRLSGVSAVSSAVVGIYTKAPQNAESEDDTAFPYITLGPFIAGAYDTKDDNGGNVLCDVHIWSRSQSSLFWRGIGDAVYDALQKYDALSVTGANVIDCRFDDAIDYADPTDGRTWHYVLTFRVTYYLT